MKKMRLGIIQSFIIIISVLFGSYLTWDYYKNLTNSRKNAHNLFLQINRNIKADLEKISAASEAILTTTKASYGAGIMGFAEPKVPNAVYMPKMMIYPFITSINFGDSLGNGYLILRDGDAWMNRIKKAAEKDEATWYKLDNKGEVVFTEKKLDDYDPRVMPWYENAVKSEGISWSDPYMFRTTKDVGITASMIIGRRGSIEGVLGVDIMLKDLSNALAELLKENPDMKARIINDEGSVIACSDVKHFLSCLKERKNLPKINECGYDILEAAMNASEAEKPLVDFSFEGRRFISAHESIKFAPTKEFSLILTVPEKTLLMDFYKTALWKTTIFLAILILASGWYIRRYLIPLKKLSIEMKKLGAGESAKAIAIAPRNDEIGDVASEFERMRHDIEKYHDDIFKSSKELATLNERLKALWEISKMADADYSTLCNRVTSEIMSMSQSKYGFYGIINEDESVMKIYAWSGNVMRDCSLHSNPFEFPIENAGIWAEAVKNKQPLIVNDYLNETSDLKKGLPDGHVAINRLLVIPVIREGKTAAVAAVANKRIGYTKEDSEHIKAFLSSAQVVIDRKKAVEFLEESERKYRKMSAEFNALLDAVPDSITLYGRNLNVVWANNSAAKAVGLNLSTITGFYCGDMWLKRGSVSDSCLISRSFQDMEAINEVIISRDGKIWDVRTIPIFDEGGGGVVNVMEVCRDITDHSRLEEQLRHAQKMEAVGQLTGGIAHDFNNILSAIIGYGHLLKIKAENVIGDEEINEILKAADRGAKLTQSLLAFSRKQVMNMKPVDLNEIVRNMNRLILRTLGEDVELRTDLSSEGVIVEADYGQIEQALLNLTINAKDAMPDGGMLKIETGFFNINEDFVSAHSYGKPGRYAIMTVSDTGIGMDADTKDRIFEPFFTTKEVGKGTGLGLAIIYGIIKQHGGYINVYSECGKGTTFRIYLPLAEKMKELSLPAAKCGIIALPQGIETILVAEDEESLRKLFSAVLQKSGYSVIEAENGEEAVARFAENKDSINLVILDAIMPKKNGREAFEDIKKIMPDAKAIFISGYTADVIHEKGILEDGINFIMKPVAPEEFLRKVRKVLDREN